MQWSYYNSQAFTINITDKWLYRLIAGCIISSCFIMAVAPSVGRILAMIAAASFILAIFRPSIVQILFAVSLLMGIIPLQYHEHINLLFSVILILGTFGLVIKLALQMEKPQRNPTLELFAILFCVFSFLTLLSTIYNSISLSYGVVDASRYLLYGGLMWFIYHEVKSIENIKKLIWSAIIIAFISTIIVYKSAFETGLFSNFTKLGITMMRNTSASLANPNAISTILTFPLPFMISYLMFFPSKKYKLVCALGLLLLIPAWLSLNSRGNYLFLALSLFVLALFHKKRKVYLTIMVFLALILSVSIFTNAIPFLGTLFRLERGLTFRDTLWDAAWRMAMESPILGKGPGSYDQNKFYYMDPEVGRQIVGTWPDVSPHSVLLMRAVDIGIFGVLNQIIIWLLPIVAVFKSTKKLSNYKYNFIFYTIASMWVGLIAKSIFDTGANVIILIFIPILLKFPEFVTPK